MSFKDDIKKFADLTEQSLAETLKQTAFQIFSSVNQLTPVKTGRARASWNISINDVDLNVKEPGEYDYSLNFPNFSDFSFNDTIFISNNLNYIEELERGSSKQAPKGMLSISVKNFQKFVRESIKNVT